MGSLNVILPITRIILVLEHPKYYTTFVDCLVQTILKRVEK